MSGGGAAAGAAAGSVVSSAIQAWSNRYLQKKAQAFAKETMQTQHQWEVGDLINAGLNPILSATGGSSAVSAGGFGGVTAPDITGSAIAAIRAKKDIELLNAQINKVKAETGYTVEKTEDLGKTSWLGKLMNYGVNEFKQGTPWWKAFFANKFKSSAKSIPVQYKPDKYRHPNVTVIKGRSSND